MLRQGKKHLALRFLSFMPEGVRYSHCQRFVDIFIKIIIDRLANGKRVSLGEHGILTVHHKMPRNAQNPKTGEVKIVTERATVRLAHKKGVGKLASVTELRADLAEECGVTLDIARVMFDEFKDWVGGVLDEEYEIQIRGFGSFSSKFYPARMTHNPKTGEKVYSPRKDYVHFKFSNDLRAYIEDSGWLERNKNGEFDNE